MLLDSLSSTFRFRKTTVSSLFIITIVALGLLTYWNQVSYLHQLPSTKEGERLLRNAWYDLENITRKPHPYTSHFNDEVHDYLLARVQEIGKVSPFIEIADDYARKSSKLFKQRDVFNDSSTDTRLVYFESSNIIVKIEGKRKELPGLLLSAHYDSVPTANGATDDGKGVVSLVAMLDFFAKNQPERTMVFNFNNDEEFGLLGATIFTYDPWFERVSYVVNLEGTGTGSKAVLFRTSDTGTAAVYSNSVKNQPFGNSIYQQGFYSRVISSETDYKVYEQNGLRGWDIAFYKPRNLYHTGRDSTRYTSKHALWHMMHVTWQLTSYMCMDNFEESEALLQNEEYQTPPIYFDMFGMWFFTVSAKQLYTWNIFLILIIPAIVLLQKVVCQKQKTWDMPIISSSLRIPFSLAVSFLFMHFYQSLLSSQNPLIWSRNFFLPLFSLLSQLIVLNCLILSFFEYIRPLQDFKTFALLELTFVYWITLIKITWDIRTANFKSIAIYPFTILFTCLSIGSIFGLLFMSFRRVMDDANSEEDLPHSPQQNFSTENIENLSETSPLIRSPQSSVHSDEAISLKNRNLSSMPIITRYNYDWSLQYLLVVPFAALVGWNSVVAILDSLNVSVQESEASTKLLLSLATGGSFFLISPIIPFLHKLNRFVVIFMILIAALTTTFSLVAEPFTETSPLKLRFVQKLDLSGKNSQQVEVYGRKGSEFDAYLVEIPSRPNVTCVDITSGNEKCSYEGTWPNIGIPMNVQLLHNSRYDKGHSEYEPYVADMKINVIDNRNCVLKFNGPGKELLKEVAFSMKNGTKIETYKTEVGIDSLLVHKLDWEVPYYSVQLKWIPHYIDGENFDTLGVSVDCYWGEFDSMIKNNEIVEKVPAFSELLEYLPPTIILSNRESGIVTIHKYFEL